MLLLFLGLVLFFVCLAVGFGLFCFCCFVSLFGVFLLFVYLF